MELKMHSPPIADRGGWGVGQPLFHIVPQNGIKSDPSLGKREKKTLAYFTN